jgi:branched-chain amino acid transport system ATP-binding protein
MLQVQGLSKIFGGLRAVDDASLSVDKGRIVALIGPNGAGKTTFFACVAGFHQPDAGRVHFNGQDITGMAPHLIARHGMVRTFQITQPFAKLSVLDNIMVGAYQLHARDADARAHAIAVAQKVGMAPLLGQAAMELTVAGRKRLELARALATWVAMKSSPRSRAAAQPRCRKAGVPLELYWMMRSMAASWPTVSPCAYSMTTTG